MENHETNNVNSSDNTYEVVFQVITEPTLIEKNNDNELPKKLTLNDINPEDLKFKIGDFFKEKLENLELKFKNDLEIVEPYKFEFIDLYHDFENLKLEILDFLKKKEEKKPATNLTAIRRNDTSRSRTPLKSTTSKVASTKDVTKNANNKISLETNSKINDKNRSQTPLTAKKLNEKSQKEVSVKKVDTKKIVNSNLDTTINNLKNGLKTPKANKDKNTNQNANEKKRETTPVVSGKNNKSLDTSVISHNETVNVQNTQSNNPGKSAKNRSVIKMDKNSNHVSNLKKPTESNENKRKSAVNINAGLSEEAQSVSNFSNTINSTGKKKSILGALNSSIQGEVAENNISQKDFENITSNNKRTSLNQGNQKGERKSSMPAQRGSLGGNKRNSVEIQKNDNSLVDENAKSKEKNNHVSDDNKKIKQLDEINEFVKLEKNEFDKNKIEDKLNDDVKREEDKLIGLIDNVENQNVNQQFKILEANADKKRISINVMKQSVENDKLNFTINDENAQKRNSFLLSEENSRTINLQEKLDAETIKLGDNENKEKIILNDKTKEDRKTSISTVENMNFSNKINEQEIVKNENKQKIQNEMINNNIAHNTDKKNTDENINTNIPIISDEIKGKVKNNQNIMPENFLLSFSNKKNCGLNLLIKSGLLNIKEQVTIAFVTRELFKSNFPQIKEDFIKYLKEKIEESQALDAHNLNTINKQLIFSKVATNGLNFVKKEEENNLLKKEQNEKIIDVFRFFCILLNENHEKLAKEKIIEFFLLTVLPKNKIETLKKFISEFIPLNILNFDFNLGNLIDFVNNHHHILVSNEILSLNRSISYITFSNKEIFEYLSAKLNDGHYAHNYRKAKILLKKHNDLLTKLSQ